VVRVVCSKVSGHLILLDIDLARLKRTITVLLLRFSSALGLDPMGIEEKISGETGLKK